MKMINNFLNKNKTPLRGALFVSGSGSNAEKILEYNRNIPGTAWLPAVIVSDRPESRARSIAEEYSLPFVEVDINQFYLERGEKRVSIMTENGRRIREEWTEALRKEIKPYDIDFGILAGFIPLTNMTGDFPCLNVHPGDLTVEESGNRVLVGLHTVPVEAAIVRGFAFMRSSVIVAQPYTGAGGEMDSGPILGVSAPVEIDLSGYSLQDLIKCSEHRPDVRPRGGYGDILEKVAVKNQERLKMNGDWIVFPPVVEDFASGIFAHDDADNLYYRTENGWRKIKTVEYGSKSRKIINDEADTGI